MKRVTTLIITTFIITCFTISTSKQVSAQSLFKTDTTKGKRIRKVKFNKKDQSIFLIKEKITAEDTVGLRNPLGLDSIYSVEFLTGLNPLQKLSLWKAEKKYKAEAFYDAIKAYESVLKNTDTLEDINRKLAISYSKINEFKQAEYWYAILINNQTNKSGDIYYFAHNAEDIYSYAVALKKNEKYAESKEWMERYMLLVKDDPKGTKQMNSFNLLKNLMQDSSRFDVTKLNINSAFSDFGPAFFNDQIIFSSSRKSSILKPKYEWHNEPFLDLYISNIDGAGQLTEPQIFAKELNSKYHEGPVVYDDINEILYFTRNNYMSRSKKKRVNRLKILSAKKQGISWVNQKDMLFNNDNYSCGHPAITNNGKTMYFSSDMPGGMGGTDIYVTHLKDTTWSKPKNLGKPINTSGNEMFPYIHYNGTMYFCSNAHEGIGGLDIFYSVYKNGKFSKPVNYGYPLNSSKDDFAFILDKNNETGYFSSNRGSTSHDNLFKVIINEPNIIPDIILSGVAVRKKTGDLLSQVTITLLNKSTEESKTIITNTKGEFTTVLIPESDYELICEKEDYRDLTDSFTTKELAGYKVNLKEELEMFPYALSGIVVYRETEEAIPGISVALMDTNKVQLATLTTDQTGKFYFPLEENSRYTVKLTKGELLTRTRFITTEGTKPGIVKIKETVEMEEIKIGALIEVEILFNTGKWDIRPDAQKVLDEEVVQFMLDNPTITFELGAHTDARGSKENNQTLSQKRAESSVNYIESKGIKKGTITAKGYGESSLKNQCADGVKCSDEEHQVNRRVEIKVTGF